MVRWLRTSRSTRIALALYVLAGLLVGFGYRTHALRRQPIATEVSANALPGLSLTKRDAASAPALIPKLGDACVLVSARGLAAETEDVLRAARRARLGARPTISADGCSTVRAPDKVRPRAPPRRSTVNV